MIILHSMRVFFILLYPASIYLNWHCLYHSLCSVLTFWLACRRLHLSCFSASYNNEWGSWNELRLLFLIQFQDWSLSKLNLISQSTLPPWDFSLFFVLRFLQIWSNKYPYPQYSHEGSKKWYFLRVWLWHAWVIQDSVDGDPISNSYFQAAIGWA